MLSEYISDPIWRALEAPKVKYVIPIWAICLAGTERKSPKSPSPFFNFSQALSSNKDSLKDSSLTSIILFPSWTDSSLIFVFAIFWKSPQVPSIAPSGLFIVPSPWKPTSFWYLGVNLKFPLLFVLSSIQYPLVLSSQLYFFENSIFLFKDSILSWLKNPCIFIPAFWPLVSTWRRRFIGEAKTCAATWATGEYASELLISSKAKTPLLTKLPTELLWSTLLNLL